MPEFIQEERLVSYEKSQSSERKVQLARRAGSIFGSKAGHIAERGLQFYKNLNRLVDRKKIEKYDVSFRESFMVDFKKSLYDTFWSSPRLTLDLFEPLLSLQEDRELFAQRVRDLKP